MDKISQCRSNLLWVLRNWNNVWEWASLNVRVRAVTDRATPSPISHSVEFRVQGQVAPYDRMKLTVGRMVSTGTARLGVNLDVNLPEYGWCGGVIDHKDLVEMRDAINTHLALIDALSPDERYRLQQNLIERIRLQNNPISADDNWPEELYK
jgi:hypothetical protein